MRRLTIAAATALFIALLAGPTVADNFTFSHLAGSTGGAGADDGVGDQARFRSPGGIALAADGTLFVAESSNGTVRRISTDGTVTTFAGMAGVQQSVPGRPGQNRLSSPARMAWDAAGNLYIADARYIARATPAGMLSLWAGSIGNPPIRDGSLSDAGFLSAYALAFDSNGNLFVADEHTIRKITPQGFVSTFAGTPGLSGSVDGPGAAARFNTPQGICVDENDDLYVVDTFNHTVRRITPSGVVSTIAGLAGNAGYVEGSGSTARFSSPSAIAAAGGGIFYVSDSVNNAIRKITRTGEVYIVSSYNAGDPYACEFTDGPTTEATFCRPSALLFDASDGSLYVADAGNSAIRRITSTHLVSTVAGKGAQSGYLNAVGTAARFNGPSDLVVDGGGAIFVADVGNHVIRRIASQPRTVTLFAGSPGQTGSADGVGVAAGFNNPRGLTIGNESSLYVADTGNHTIRKIGTDASVSTFAGTANQPGSIDGSGAAARFNGPRGIAFDGTSLLVADTGNHTIRRMTTAGAVTTLAGFAGESGSADGTTLARFNFPAAIAADSAGNVYVADMYNHAIRRVTPAGAVTTIAGTAGVSGGTDGTGADARFDSPSGIAVEERDGGVFLYVSDRRAIRMIAPGNIVTTIGGSSKQAGMTDGTGALSRFERPGGLEFINGTLFIADVSNHCIRRGSPASSTVATVDPQSGAVDTVRQLAASPPATSHSWSLIRRPSGSSATLSSTSSATPTFTPDVIDVYRFRLTAVGAQLSITEVELTADCPALTLMPASLPAGRIHVPYSQSLTPGGGIPPYTISLIGGALPPGLTLSPDGTISGTPTAADTFAFIVRASDSCDSTADREYPLVIQPMAAPTGLIATATGETAVALTWSPSEGATGYRIYRSTRLSLPASVVAEVAGLTHADHTVAANTSYIYQVQAYHSQGSQSPRSAFDVATTVNFVDPLLAPGTPVKAAHITQLRTAANALRVVAGFEPSSGWTDPALASGSIVRRVHVQSLRDVILSACETLGLSTSFTDPVLGVGSPVRAIHITELRDRMK